MKLIVDAHFHTLLNEEIWWKKKQSQMICAEGIAICHFINEFSN